MTEGRTKSPRRSPLLRQAARPSSHGLSSSFPCPKITPKPDKEPQNSSKNHRRGIKHPRRWAQLGTKGKSLLVLGAKKALTTPNVLKLPAKVATNAELLGENWRPTKKRPHPLPLKAGHPAIRGKTGHPRENVPRFQAELAREDKAFAGHRGTEQKRQNFPSSAKGKKTNGRTRAKRGHVRGRNGHEEQTGPRFGAKLDRKGKAWQGLRKNWA